MDMISQTDRNLSRVANRLVPAIGDTSRIQGLQAQVEDLKYTLNNVLQCLVANIDVARESRHVALVDDARAALRAEVADYLG
jgi:hypothetical protein